MIHIYQQEGILFDKVEDELSKLEFTTATRTDVANQCQFCSYAPWTKFNKMFPKDNLTHTNRGEIIKQGDQIVRMKHSYIIFETYHRECAAKILKQINDNLNISIEILEQV